VISIICVYNDRLVLEQNLLNNLEDQLGEFELCLVDNTESIFDGAATALNVGAGEAKGEWLMFVHQDVRLLSLDWIQKTQELLSQLRPEGWVGAAGADNQGRIIGFMRDSGARLGFPFEGLREVETLDECLMIHRRLEDSIYFDTGLKGWHQYGVEACIGAMVSGAKNFVLPFPIWHNSKRTNVVGLEEAKNYVWQKYRHRFDSIHTTCGRLPRQPSRPISFSRIQNRLKAASSRLAGFVGHPSRPLNYLLEELTIDFTNIDCLNSSFGIPDMYTVSFNQFTTTPRAIIHNFDGLRPAGSYCSECLIIERDLAREVLDKPEWLYNALRSGKQCLICVRRADAETRRQNFQQLCVLARRKYISTEAGGEHVFVLHFDQA
jgi:hypothetical protein